MSLLWRRLPSTGAVCVAVVLIEVELAIGDNFMIGPWTATLPRRCRDPEAELTPLVESVRVEPSFGGVASSLSPLGRTVSTLPSLSPSPSFMFRSSAASGVAIGAVEL